MKDIERNMEKEDLLTYFEKKKKKPKNRGEVDVELFPHLTYSYILLRPHKLF